MYEKVKGKVQAYVDKDPVEVFKRKYVNKNQL